MHAGLRLRFFLLGSLARFLLFLGWLLALYGGVRGEKSLSIEHDVGRWWWFTKVRRAWHYLDLNRTSIAGLGRLCIILLLSSLLRSSAHLENILLVIPLGFLDILLHLLVVHDCADLASTAIGKHIGIHGLEVLLLLLRHLLLLLLLLSLALMIALLVGTIHNDALLGVRGLPGLYHCLATHVRRERWAYQFYKSSSLLSRWVQFFLIIALCVVLDGLILGSVTNDLELITNLSLICIR